MSEEPRYAHELTRYVEERLSDPVSVLAAVCAILTDPAAYTRPKGQPRRTLLEFVSELVLSNRRLQAHIQEAGSPVSRELLDGAWALVWKGARGPATSVSGFAYDACISFAGADRGTAEEIATCLSMNGLNRRVFYDDFETTALWGEELFEYLHDIYAQKSMFCVILFSHAYRQRAWTQHELRAAQARMLTERNAYILPVELDAGAVPKEFASVAYWPFASGDEPRIAEAIEEKINGFLVKHYSTLDEVTEAFTHDIITKGLLTGFRAGIRENLYLGDPEQADALALLAVIAASDTTSLWPTVRALLNLIVFSAGSVGDMFSAEDQLAIIGKARISRWLGSGGPLLFQEEGWAPYLEPVVRRLSAHEAEEADS